MVFCRRRGVAQSSGVLACLFAVATAIFAFGDFFAGRLLQLGFDSADRIAVYKLTLLSILDEPFKGFGYGTFQYVFPLYRDNSVNPYGFWDKAHNTYLEIFQGLGIPIAVAYLVALLLLIGRCGQGAIIRRSSTTAPVVATAASTVVILHSFVDFSMQMQAVALTWTALLGAGVAQSWSSQSDTRI
jgi:O-antigen ligase